MNDITRKYNHSDGILLTHMGKVLVGLAPDVAEFELLFPMINQAFYDTMNADYTTALQEGGDEVSRGQVGIITQQLVNEMDNSRGLMKRFKFWISQTFHNDPARKRSFNLSKFWKVANSQPHLITFMNSFRAVVQTNEAALLAAGMPPNLVTELEANVTALAELDATQENSKSGRSNATQTRVMAMNSLYERALLLSNAADILYEDNTVKREFYSLPGVTPSAEEVDELLDEESMI